MPQIYCIFLLFKINKVGYTILWIKSTFDMLKKNDYIIEAFLKVIENTEKVESP